MNPALLPLGDWPVLLRSTPYFSRAIIDALHAAGPDGFAPLVRAVYYFDLFDAQVSNGGVDQYFDNVAAHLDDAAAVPSIIAANPVYAPALPLIEEAHAIWNAVADAYRAEDDGEDEDEDDLLAPHEERMEAIATAFFALHHALRQRLEEDIVRDPQRYFALAPVPGLRGRGVEHVALADGAYRLRFVEGFPLGPNVFENEDGGCDVVWFSPDRTLLQCETAGFGDERSRHWIHYPSQASSSWTTGENFMSGALQAVRNDRLALGLGHHGLHETFLANGQRESASLYWHGQELCSEHFYRRLAATAHRAARRRPALAALLAQRGAQYREHRRPRRPRPLPALPGRARRRSGARRHRPPGRNAEPGRRHAPMARRRTGGRLPAGPGAPHGQPARRQRRTRDGAHVLQERTCAVITNAPSQ